MTVLVLSSVKKCLQIPMTVIVLSSVKKCLQIPMTVLVLSSVKKCLPIPMTVMVLSSVKNVYRLRWILSHLSRYCNVILSFVLIVLDETKWCMVHRRMFENAHCSVSNEEVHISYPATKCNNRVVILK